MNLHNILAKIASFRVRPPTANKKCIAAFISLICLIIAGLTAVTYIKLMQNRAISKIEKIFSRITELVLEAKAALSGHLSQTEKSSLLLELSNGTIESRDFLNHQYIKSIQSIFSGYYSMSKMEKEFVLDHLRRTIPVKYLRDFQQITLSDKKLTHKLVNIALQVIKKNR
ncbi:MAG: hypothetical protein KAH32_01620 [Chlamydiia bacterium]|nr:hypothetical protein [Chlamydiia bacterium]